MDQAELTDRDELLDKAKLRDQADLIDHAIETVGETGREVDEMPSVVIMKRRKGGFNIVGSATLLKRGLTPVRFTEDELGARCMFLAAVDMYPTGGITPTGKKEWELTIMNFSAFRDVARLCNKELKPGREFMFTGRMRPDPYWTERSGRMSYQVDLSCVIPMPYVAREIVRKDGNGEIIEEPPAEPDTMFGDPDY